MKILSIDASGEACSAALCIGESCLEQFELAPRQHTQRLLPMLEALLAQADCSLVALDGLAFARGPGSFTGIRVAASIMQGIALGADLPVLGISTLAALAEQAWRVAGLEQVSVAMDARMGQVYWGQYQRQAGCLCLQGAEQVLTPGPLLLTEVGQTVCIGNGWQVYQAAFAGNLPRVEEGFAYPHAQDVARLAVAEFRAGRKGLIDEALPIYIRDQVTQG